MIKALYNVSYGTIANELGIKPTSFYNYLSGHYALSSKKQMELQAIIDKYNG